MLDRPFSPDTRIVSRKEKPPVLERGCDICVIGSGASGISAAVEAARAGRSVILVDGLPSLGGQAVNSIIGMFCGLYMPGKDGRQVTHGIADEILHDLGVTNDVKVVAGGVMKVAMYNEVALGRWVEKAVLAAGDNETGCSVHYVTDAYDEGAVIFQLSCPVRPDDTPESLAQRVLALEHVAYPEAIAKALAKRVNGA